MSQLNTVTALGSGLLGGQIGWHSAFKGKRVTLYDVSEDALTASKAAFEQYGDIYRATFDASDADVADTHARLTFTTDLAVAVAEADLVIEAVPEIPKVKAQTFTALAPHLPDRTIVVTNSSTLLPSQFSEATGRPDRFCALHFGNGIWAMNLAEIMAGPATTDATLLQVTQFAIEIGMMPIPVRKEQSGYVVNTWFVALVNAAQTLVTNGIATHEDVDRSFMKFGAPIGPFGLLDQVGMPLVVDVLSYWGGVNSDAQMTANAAYVKQHMVDRGRLGAKSGRGYYSWPEPAFLAPNFLAVPDISAAAGVVAQIRQA